MSGWIKMEKDLGDDPRVKKMALCLRNAGVTHERFTYSALVTLVVGGLYQLWRYADTHVRDDDTLDLGVDQINEIIGIQGFCEILPEEWMEILDAESVKLPGFHTHNGTEAKKKALTQKRVSKHRHSVTQERNKHKRPIVTTALPDQDQDQDQDHKKVPTEPVPLERGTDVADPDPVMKVFQHWQEVHRKPRAKLDDKRRTLIRKALKHYGDADLCQAISGYLNSPHHMGQNDQATVYDDIELMLRDSKHIDAGLKFYADPPRTDLSPKTRAIVAATENWVPPESRHAGN